MENKTQILVLLIVFLMFFSASFIPVKELSSEKKLSETGEQKLTLHNDLYKAYIVSYSFCSPLGFCIGDKVTITEKFLKRGVNFTGTIVNVEDKCLVVKVDGTENKTRRVHEANLRHLYNPQLSQLTQEVFNEILTDLNVEIEYSKIYKTEVILISSSFNSENKTGEATFFIENELCTQKFTAYELLEIMKYKDYSQTKAENQ